MESNAESNIESRIVGGKSHEDELFKAINENPQVKKYCNRIQQMCLILMYLGSFFFVMGLVGLLYKNKAHLTFFGLICLLHVIGGCLGWRGVGTKNRYLLFSFMVMNTIWFFSTLILLLLYGFAIGSGKRGGFRSEIVMHVGLVFYMPISVMTGYWSFCFLKHLASARKEGELKVVQTASDAGQSKLGPAGVGKEDDAKKPNATPKGADSPKSADTEKTQETGSTPKTQDKAVTPNTQDNAVTPKTQDNAITPKIKDTPKSTKK